MTERTPDEQASAKSHTKKRMGFWRQLGPGLITGASDEDPGNIATYSQVGSAFGYLMLWTVWLLYPLVVAIQEISGRIGRVTGLGLASNIRLHYSRTMLYLMVVLLLIANTINIAADLAAMGTAVTLLIGGRPFYYALALGIFSLTLEVIVTYERYARLLKWLAVVLFAYVATAFVAHVDWAAAAYHFFVPTIQWNHDYLMATVAVFGTTISPYLFFWQSGQEVEIERDTPGEEALKEAPQQAPRELRRIRTDTLVGMGLSQLIALFILLTAAATLAHLGLKEVPSATQAAQALRPVAGDFAFALFSIGLVGTGLLAIPALAGSIAYAGAETLLLPEGLSRKPYQAKGFYAIMGAATLGGAALDLLAANPIAALYYSAIVNGVVAVPMMLLMMRMATRHDVMGPFVLSPGLRLLGWIATAAMGVCAATLIVTLVFR